MFHTRVHQECIELLLGAITSHIGDDGMRASFLFGKVGARHWEKHMGANIYYHPRELVLACLYLRKNGPAYLRALPLDAIRKLLQNFVTDNYCYLAKEVLLQRFEKTYAQHISAHTKLLLADELDVSAIFKPVLDLTLYPLVPIIAGKSFVSDAFFLLSPAELTREGLSDDVAKWITADSFPPLVDWKGKTELGVGSWLGIRSPVIQAANKTKAAILGAIALTSQPMYRYMFSGRQ